jgi:hypothetical protein
MEDLELSRPVLAIEEFDGVFDGGGRTITSLRGSGNWIRVNKGRIQNANFAKGCFSDHPDHQSCALVGVNRGVIADLRVHSENQSLSLDPEVCAAGLAGVNESIIERCVFSGVVQALHGSAGGLVGYNAPDGRIIECLVDAGTAVGSTHGKHVGGVCAVSGGALILTRVNRGVRVHLSAEGEA